MLAMIVIAVAALYFGRDIFVPLALAMLLSFALAPVVRWLRRLFLPNLPAVLVAVSVAFLAIFALGSLVAWQVADLAERLPTYRSNIEAKIDSLREAPPGGYYFARASDMLRDLGRKIEQEDRKAAAQERADDGSAGDEPAPVAVEIHRPAPTSMQIISTVIGPLISPLATAGIVIVFVIFMLLKREDLRDRLIRLTGSRGLPRTTQALEDAAQRVGRYLLMQLVVNTAYAVPIGVGLWLIGIPNPILWGLLCALHALRPLYRPDRRGVLSARPFDRNRSRLDDAAPDRRALHRRRADNQLLRWSRGSTARAPACRRLPSSPRRSSGPGSGDRSACCFQRRSRSASSCSVVTCRSLPSST